MGNGTFVVRRCRMVSAVNCGITGILDPVTARFPGSLLRARLEARERMAHGAADERVSVQPHTQSRPSRLALSLIVLSAAAAPGSWLMSHTARSTARSPSQASSPALSSSHGSVYSCESLLVVPVLCLLSPRLSSYSQSLVPFHSQSVRS
jgi:hypothetical protein